MGRVRAQWQSQWPGLAIWPAYDPATDTYLELGDVAAARSGGWRANKLDLLDDYYESIAAAG